MANYKNSSSKADENVQDTIRDVKLIQQRLANTIGRSSDVFISGVETQLNEQKRKVYKVKVLVGSNEQCQALINILNCEYIIEKDKLEIDIQSLESSGFNPPPQSLGGYLTKGLRTNPLVSRIEETQFGVGLYIEPVTLQFSSTTGDYNINQFAEPAGTYVAANEFKKILKDDIRIESMVNQFHFNYT